MHPILKIENMNIFFPQKNGRKVIVENGEFEVNSGEFVMILGENGAGKTSIFRSIVREYFNYKSSENDSRDMFFKGEPVDTQEKLDAFRRSIGYVRQSDDDDRFFSRRVWSYVRDYVEKSEKFSGNEAEAEMQSVYDALRCDRYADGQLKNRKLSRCSGGEKRMATLLAALSRTRSDLFVLDEPINNLDAYHARILNNYLVRLKSREKAPGILVITHCQMFQSVDKVYRLNKGKLTLIDDYKPKSCFGECSECGLYPEED